ncbi:unnamed protein product [Penicillium pancosmium]
MDTASAQSSTLDPDYWDSAPPLKPTGSLATCGVAAGRYSNPSLALQASSSNASPRSHGPINIAAEGQNPHDNLIPDQTSSSALVVDDPGASETDGFSRTLYGFLPSRQDTAIIYKASGGHHSIPFHEVLTIPYGIHNQDSGLRSQERLREVPGPNSHPVLIARHMLHLASFLQHLHPDPDLNEELRGLSEPPLVIRERLADRAISLATPSDRFVGSIEFLECIMIESFVSSELRVFTTKLDGCATSHDYYAVDGLSSVEGPGSVHGSSSTDQGTPGHYVVSHCLLRSTDVPYTRYDYTWTQNLDKELQRAARNLPSRWWLVPNLSGEKEYSQAMFWEMRRLSEQLFYYNLLNQLHLPYLFRDSVERQFDYSQITCVNASREVLSRFIMLRRWDQVAVAAPSISLL